MTSRFQAAIAAVAVFASLCIVGIAADEPEAVAVETVALDDIYRSPLRVGQIQVQSADTLTYRDEDGTHDATYRIVDGKTVEIRMTIDGKAVTKIFTITPYGLRPESGPTLYGNGGYVVKTPTFEFNRITARENAYTRTSYYVLGDYLGGTYAGKTLVVLTINEDVDDEYGKMVTDALNEGLADRMTVKVARVGPELGDANHPAAIEMIGGYFSLTPDDFESVLNKHVPGYATIIDGKAAVATAKGDPRDVVVLSLIGLPMAIDDMPWWKIPHKNRPILVLMNPQLYVMKEHIVAGRIDGVMAGNPDAFYDPGAPLPSSMIDAFHDRFVLVNTANVARQAKRYPSLFGDDD